MDSGRQNIGLNQCPPRQSQYFGEIRQVFKHIIENYAVKMSLVHGL